MNESICNSKQKWNCDECQCECKELADCGSCEKDWVLVHVIVSVIKHVKLTNI